MARPLEEASLVEGNLSAVVYNHLGNEVICSEGIDHAPGESGHDLHFSMPWTLEIQIPPPLAFSTQVSAVSSPGPMM